MFRNVVVCLSVLTLPQAGWAADDCAVVDSWLTAQGAGVADLGPGQCSGQVNPDGQVCRWDFPYRADAAQAAFDAMSARLLACAGPDRLLADDQQVNHPDSYALNRYALRDKEVALSLKDKASLGKSLIFLRTAPLTRD